MASCLREIQFGHVRLTLRPLPGGLWIASILPFRARSTALKLSLAGQQLSHAAGDRQTPRWPEIYPRDNHRRGDWRPSTTHSPPVSVGFAASTKSGFSITCPISRLPSERQDPLSSGGYLHLSPIGL